MSEGKSIKGFAMDGANRRGTVLQEGAVRKGGTNSSQSQIQIRPAAPAPMRPASGNTGGSSGSQSGGSNSSGKKS